MIVKILIGLFCLWLFFKLFGKRILLYLIKKIVQKLEQQTLKDMKHFHNLYDENARQSYPLNNEYSVIVPEPCQKSRRKEKVIEDVEFTEIPNDFLNEGNTTY